MSEFPTPPAFNGEQPTADERNMAVIAHVGNLLSLVTGLGFIVPLVIMLTKGTQSPFVRREAVESLNFAISVIIYSIISAVLCLVLIGFLLLAAVGLFALIMPIIAASKVSSGEGYRYPLILRIVS